MTINKGIQAGDHATFENTQVGDHNTMSVSHADDPTRDAIERLDALIRELRDERERISDAEQAASEARDELSREEPDGARIDRALDRLASLADTVAAVGRAIGMG